VHCDAGPMRNPNRPFGFGCCFGLILALKHRLNRKLAAMDARPDEGQSRSYQALKIKEKNRHQRSILVLLNAVGIPIDGRHV
jgi:hypothetical protein